MVYNTSRKTYLVGGGKAASGSLILWDSAANLGLYHFAQHAQSS